MSTPPLRCASCGIEGKAATIDTAPGDERPILRPAFNYHADGRPALICDLCRDDAGTARLTGRRS